MSPPLCTEGRHINGTMLCCSCVQLPDSGSLSTTSDTGCAQARFQLSVNQVIHLFTRCLFKSKLANPACLLGLLYLYVLAK